MSDKINKTPQEIANESTKEAMSVNVQKIKELQSKMKTWKAENEKAEKKIKRKEKRLEAIIKKQNQITKDNIDSIKIEMQEREQDSEDAKIMINLYVEQNKELLNSMG